MKGIQTGNKTHLFVPKCSTKNMVVSCTLSVGKQHLQWDLTPENQGPSMGYLLCLGVTFTG